MRTKLVFGLFMVLTSFALFVAGSLPIRSASRLHLKGGASMVDTKQGTRVNAQRLPELLPREKETDLALNAAPEHLRKSAGVYVLERHGFVKIRESTNGFTCIVNRDHPLSLKPVCFDAEGTATILPKILRVGELLMQGKAMSEINAEIAEGFRTGKYIAPRRSGVAYM